MTEGTGHQNPVPGALVTSTSSGKVSAETFQGCHRSKWRKQTAREKSVLLRYGQHSLSVGNRNDLGKMLTWKQEGVMTETVFNEVKGWDQLHEWEAWDQDAVKKTKSTVQTQGLVSCLEMGGDHFSILMSLRE